MQETFTLTITDNKGFVLSVDTYGTLQEARLYRSGFYQIRDAHGILIEAQW
jgi:hypothetical protein